jgi:hypothetical protein
VPLKIREELDALLLLRLLLPFAVQTKLLAEDEVVGRVVWWWLNLWRKHKTNLGNL